MIMTDFIVILYGFIVIFGTVSADDPAREETMSRHKHLDSGIMDKGVLDFTAVFQIVMPSDAAVHQGLCSFTNSTTTLITLHGAPYMRGDMIPENGIIGNLTHPKIRSECENFPPGDVLLTWFDSCSDLEQIEEATRKGIKAIIFVVSSLQHVVGTSDHNFENTIIPISFLEELPSIVLWDVWNGNIGRYVRITLDDSQYRNRVHGVRTLWSVLAFFLVLYIFVVQVLRFMRTHNERRREQNRDKRYRELMDGLPLHSVATTPTDDNDCPICQENFKRGDRIRKLIPCTHDFHDACIDPWFKAGKSLCPKCRNPVQVTPADVPPGNVASGSTPYGAI